MGYETNLFWKMMMAFVKEKKDEMMTKYDRDLMDDDEKIAFDEYIEIAEELFVLYDIVRNRNWLWTQKEHLHREYMVDEKAKRYDLFAKPENEK